MRERLEKLIMQNIDRAPTDPNIWWRGMWWSGGTLAEMADDCEKALSQSGFSSGQRLALLLPNSPLFTATCIAAWRLGGTVVPVNPQLKSGSLTDYLERLDLFAAVVSRENDGLTELVRDTGIPSVSASLGDALPMIDGREAVPDRDSEIAALFHTAGATGNAKAVPVTHRAILSIMSSILELIPSIDEDDVILNAIPNYHSFGFVIGNMLPLAFGMPQVTLSSFMPPKTTLSTIRGSGVTIIPAVPLMLNILLDGDRNSPPLTRIKLVFCGGGRPTEALRERTENFFGVKILEGYGLTEAASVLAVTPSEEAIRPGTSGCILPCFDAEVRGEDGSVLPCGEHGRLWIRGDALSDGYYRAPEISAERFRDGWFDTQDIVSLDEDGYITIISPSVDVITTGGLTVYPPEVEAVLMSHPDITDAAVIGVQGGRKGEIVRAFVVLREGSLLKGRDILKYCRNRLPNYKAPRSIKIMSELPKNSLGKVMKKELRDA